MAALCPTTGMVLKQQAVQLHHPIGAVRVRRGAAVLLSLTAQEVMDSTIAIGWEVGDERADRGDKVSIGRWRATSPPRHSFTPGLPGRYVSSTIRTFSSAHHRRRRRTDVITSTRSYVLVIGSGIQVKP